jgi:hypothetical protein
MQYVKVEKLVENLANTLDQIESKLSGLEDKGDEWEHSDNVKEKIKIYE